jgi:hypothetical protein
MHSSPQHQQSTDGHGDSLPRPHAARSLRVATAVAALASVAVAASAADAAAPQRQSSKTYNAPAGATGLYPQMFLDHDASGVGEGLDEQVVGGWIGGARKHENRFSVEASDATGRPVALTLYWYDDLRKTNRSAVVCGRTSAPLPVVPGTGVHALATAGDGCPGGVSLPTRGTITFTWSYEKPRR